MSGPVVVIGAGLVGASVGMALTQAGRHVHVTDRVTSHALVAAGLGAGSAEAPDPQQVEVVVVAVPPDALTDVVADALQRYPRAVVTDVGSVKGAVLRTLVPTPGLERYVGSHPMAGSHRSGPVPADGDLFLDRTWVITPHPTATEAAIQTVRDLADDCGAVVVEMDPAEHDTAVAAVSHLPHLMSVLTADRLNDVPASHLRLAGQGLRDVTRIAGSDPQLWTQILSANAEALRPQLDAVRTRLDMLIDELDTRTALTGVLSSGVRGTRRIPGKHGARAHQWAQVVVEIPDAPGALARLFGDVQQTGISIEDLQIEHDAVREVGFLALSVDPAQEELLADTLADHNWDLRA
ncbi:prephenate dehydrogenase [Propionibacteriaceae bacterium Y1685]